MTAAPRNTPTQANGGSDNGVTYTDIVDRCVAALFQCSHNWLTNVGGTANAITADSDTALVEPITAYARPMAFWLVPAADNTGAVTIDIDDVGAVAIGDKDGNPLGPGSLVAGRAHEIVYDSAQFRLLGVTGSSGSPITNVNGGRLTISAGVPVLGIPVTGATAVRWEPDASNEISLFNGSDWDLVTSAAVSMNFTDTQTGTTHNGTKTIDGMADTSRLMVGMKLAGTNVGSGAVIASIDSPTQITASVNSTGNGSTSITSKVPADTAVDIFGKEVSSALQLRGVFRATFNTPNVTAKQNGVDVLDADHTLRWLGCVASSATDGQIDWVLNGQRRYRVWNRDNRRYYRNREDFAASGTWYKPIGLVEATLEVAGPGGNSVATGGPGTSSFGSHASATGGTGGGGSPGAGSGGDTNFSGMGGFGVVNFVASSAGSRGGLAVRTRSAASFAASETVTLGTPAGDGGKGWVLVHELVEG